MLKRYSFGVITRKANKVMAQIHNDGENRGRMPLFLPLEQSKEFLEEGLSEGRYKELLEYEMPSEGLEYHPVYTIRTPKNRPDEKGKHERWEWEQLPELGVGDPDSEVQNSLF